MSGKKRKTSHQIKGTPPPTPAKCRKMTAGGRRAKREYLRFYEALSQLGGDKVLDALNQTVSPQAAQNEQLLKAVQRGVPLSRQMLSKTDTPVAYDTSTLPAKCARVTPRALYL